jgi:hypothetical protein
MQVPRNVLILPALAAVSLLTAAAMPAFAANSSQWDTDSRSAVRLVAARMVVESGIPMLRAGVEVNLQSGWKTYWRMPGDAGVAPSLDWAESTNIANATLSFPAYVAGDKGLRSHRFHVEAREARLRTAPAAGHAAPLGLPSRSLIGAFGRAYSPPSGRSSPETGA